MDTLCWPQFNRRKGNLTARSKMLLVKGGWMVHHHSPGLHGHHFFPSLDYPPVKPRTFYPTFLFSPSRNMRIFSPLGFFFLSFGLFIFSLFFLLYFFMIYLLATGNIVLLYCAQYFARTVFVFMLLFLSTTSGRGRSFRQVKASRITCVSVTVAQVVVRYRVGTVQWSLLEQGRRLSPSSVLLNPIVPGSGVIVTDNPRIPFWNGVASIFGCKAFLRKKLSKSHGAGNCSKTEVYSSVVVVNIYVSFELRERFVLRMESCYHKKLQLNEIFIIL